MSFLFFFVLGGVTFTQILSIEAADSTKNIKVVDGNNLTYYVDNVKKVPPSGQSGFIYNGTTYVPLRFISEAIGEDVTWDGKTRSIYIGDKPQGTVTYLQDLKTHTGSILLAKSVTTNTNEIFTHSSYNSWGTQTPEYLINGQMDKFEAYLAPTNYYNSLKKNDNIGYLKIYGDDKLLYDSGIIASDITEKVKVSVDLTGVLRIKLEFYGKKLGLLDAKFIH